MRETRQSGSEGGEAESLPYPYRPTAEIPAFPVCCTASGVDGRVRPGHDREAVPPPVSVVPHNIESHPLECGRLPL